MSPPGVTHDLATVRARAALLYCARGAHKTKKENEDLDSTIRHPDSTMGWYASRLTGHTGLASVHYPIINNVAPVPDIVSP